jgi:DNA-binding transcriptional ArsR family regulator
MYSFTDRIKKNTQTAILLKAMGHLVRVELLMLLEGGEVSVGALEDQLEIPQAVISHHLAVLRRANLIQRRREGTLIFYHLTDEASTMATIEAAYCLVDGV